MGGSKTEHQSEMQVESTEDAQHDAAAESSLRRSRRAAAARHATETAAEAAAAEAQDPVSAAVAAAIEYAATPMQKLSGPGSHSFFGKRRTILDETMKPVLSGENDVESTLHEIVDRIRSNTALPDTARFPALCAILSALSSYSHEKGAAWASIVVPALCSAAEQCVPQKGDAIAHILGGAMAIDAGCVAEWFARSSFPRALVRRFSESLSRAALQWIVDEVPEAAPQAADALAHVELGIEAAFVYAASRVPAKEASKHLSGIICAGLAIVWVRCGHTIDPRAGLIVWTDVHFVPAVHGRTVSSRLLRAEASSATALLRSLDAPLLHLSPLPWTQRTMHSAAARIAAVATRTARQLVRPAEADAARVARSSSIIAACGALRNAAPWADLAADAAVLAGDISALRRTLTQDACNRTMLPHAAGLREILADALEVLSGKRRAGATAAAVAAAAVAARFFLSVCNKDEEALAKLSNPNIIKRENATLAHCIVGAGSSAADAALKAVELVMNLARAASDIRTEILAAQLAWPLFEYRVDAIFHACSPHEEEQLVLKSSDIAKYIGNVIYLEELAFLVRRGALVLESPADAQRFAGEQADSSQAKVLPTATAGDTELDNDTAGDQGADTNAKRPRRAAARKSRKLGRHIAAVEAFENRSAGAAGDTKDTPDSDEDYDTEERGSGGGDGGDDQNGDGRRKRSARLTESSRKRTAYVTSGGGVSKQRESEDDALDDDGRKALRMLRAAVAALDPSASIAVQNALVRDFLAELAQHAVSEGTSIAGEMT